MILRGLLKAVFALTLLLGCVGQVHAHELVFSSALDSRTLLASRDAFLTRLSPFDRAARMKTDRDVSEAQYAEFVAASALDWDQREKSLVEAAFQKILAEATRLSLPLPDTIYAIKTSGREEGMRKSCF